MPLAEISIVAGLIALLVAAALGAVILRRRRARSRLPRAASRHGEAARVAELVSHFQPAAVRVLTAGERAVFETSRRALPHHIVMPQVPLLRYLRAHDESNSSQWLRELSVLCADILVCDASARPLVAIDVHPEELSPRSARRHLRLKQLLEGAGVRMVVLHEDRLPDVESMRAILLPLLPTEDEEDAESSPRRRHAGGTRSRREPALGATQPRHAAKVAAESPAASLQPADDGGDNGVEDGSEMIIVGKGKGKAQGRSSRPEPDLDELLAEGDDIAARHPSMEPVSLTFFDEFEPLQRSAQPRHH